MINGNAIRPTDIGLPKEHFHVAPVQIGPVYGGRVRGPICPKHVSARRMQGDPSGLLQDRRVQDGPAHSPEMVDIRPNELDFRPGPVDEVQSVRYPVQGKAFDRRQIRGDQNLLRASVAQALPADRIRDNIGKIHAIRVHVKVDGDHVS